MQFLSLFLFDTRLFLFLKKTTVAINFRSVTKILLLFLLLLLFFRHEFVSFFHTLASHGDFLWLGILPSFLPPLFHSPPPGERRLPFLSLSPFSSLKKVGCEFMCAFTGENRARRRWEKKEKGGVALSSAPPPPLFAHHVNSQRRRL